MSNRFLYYRLPVIAWLIFHFILSSIPGSSYPDTGIPFASYMIHWIIFAWLAFMMLRDFWYQKTETPDWKTIGIVLVLTFLWGLSDEIHQEYFVYQRYWENADLVMNTVGSFCGVFFYVFLHKQLNLNRFSLLKEWF